MTNLNEVIENTIKETDRIIEVSYKYLINGMLTSEECFHDCHGRVNTLGVLGIDISKQKQRLKDLKEVYEQIEFPRRSKQQ